VKEHLIERQLGRWYIVETGRRERPVLLLDTGERFAGCGFTVSQKAANVTKNAVSTDNPACKAFRFCA